MAYTDQELDQLGKSARDAAKALEQITGLNKDYTKSADKQIETIKNNSKATGDVNKAMALYEKTIGRNIKSAYQGEKAGKQFAVAIDQAADILTILVALAGPFGKLGKVIGILGIQLAKLFGKESVEQAQKLYDTYHQIGSVGGAAGTSLEDLAKTAMKAGFGLDQLDDFAAIVRTNGDAFSMFAGSVADGTKAFTDIVEPLVYGKVGEKLQNMGLSIDEIREGAARYTKLQARMGFSQRSDTAALTKSTAGYLENLNLISRLTGATVDEQQRAQDQLMSQQRFRAAFEEAKMSGDTMQMQKMQKAMTMYTYYASIGAQDLAQGVADATTDFIGTSKAAGQIFLAVPEILSILNNSKLSALESIRLTSESAGNTARRYVSVAKMTDAVGDTFGNFADSLDAQRRARNLTEDRLNKIRNQQTVDPDGQIAKFTKATIGLQYNARDAFQELILKGVDPATDAMAAYAVFVNGMITGTRNKKSLLGNVRDTITNPDSYKMPSDVSQRNNREKLRLDGKKDFVWGLADGGLARAGRPYVVGENGPEVFVPDQNGEVISNQMSSDPGQIMRGNNQQITDILSTMPKDLAEVMRSKVSSNEPKSKALEQALEAELLKDSTPTALETPTPKMSNEEKELIQQQNAKLDQVISILARSNNISNKILSTSYS